MKKLKQMLIESKILKEGTADDLKAFRNALIKEIDKHVNFPTRIYLDEGDFDGDIASTKKCSSAKAYAIECINTIFGTNGYDTFNEYLEMYSNFASEDLNIDSLVKQMCSESTKPGFGVAIDEISAVCVWEDDEDEY